MADKSFGDYSNRNIVKNPLLSTAVTGLSIEDLTHNAVLLPVSQSQELITRQDHVTQNVTLGNPNNAAQKFPSGDTNFNPNSFISIQNTTSTYPPSNLPPKSNTNTEFSSSTQSKASAKSDDDFDVNEYFARLQSTRYVSAPLNSNLKEDTNANIDAEENLEEINLNDDKSQTDVQQSITADIAQNFSQLPTVLPQVASAVFSSFSNMLSMKRDAHEEVKSMYQEEKRDETAQSTPLMGVSETREVAPPPLLQPPQLTGSTNYRLPTKKKYAQIPGLSSGEIRQIPTYNPTNQPPITSNYFVPKLSGNTDIDLQKTDPNNMADNAANEKEINIDSNSFNVPNIPETNIYQNASQSDTVKANIFAPTFDQVSYDVTQSGVFQNPSQSQTNVPTSLAIIPPPPMFSNTKRDSQSSTEKSVLPPSVARRISGNQPIVKSQTSVPTFVPTDIFTPSVDTFSKDSTVQVPASQTLSSSSFIPYSQTVDKGSNLPPTVSSIDLSRSQYVPTSNIQTASMMSLPPISLPTPPTANLPPYSSVNIATPEFENRSLPFSSVSNTPSAIYNPFPSMASSQQYLNASIPSIPDPIGIVKQDDSKPVDIQPTMFTPGPPQSQTETITPPTFFNPNMYSSNANVEDKAQERTIASILEPRVPPEPPKLVIEPPKATGNVNYRMTKKRPQYYVGPIEGLGAISNNIKPVIQPVEPNPFQGSLFTPQYQEPPVQSVEYVPFDVNKQAQESVPFNINRASATSNTPYNANNALQSNDYNTAFNMSRQLTDNYEEPSRQEKSFGIIGSLKSKLSSIDMNKIQNSVTTFFDPAYNDTKQDPASVQENVPHVQQQFGQDYPQSNFEIFVPNQPLNVYDQSYQQQKCGQSQKQQYYGPTNTDYNQYQPYSSQSYTPVGANVNVNTPEMLFPPPNTQTEPIESNLSVLAEENTQATLKNATRSQQTDSNYNKDSIANMTTARSFFDDPKDVRNTTDIFSPKQCENTFQSASNILLNEEKEMKLRKDIEELADGALKQEYVNFSLENTQIVVKDSTDSKSSKPDISTTALLGLSSMLADKSKELTQLESDLQHLAVEETENFGSVFSRDENINFFDNLKLENKLNEIKEEENSLDICETCREVDRPECKETDDLTTQLIENITSPIQLLNPVEVPLTENELITEINDFDPEQCAEISHIAEETIEAIQVQSAVELLDEPLENNVRDYGWNAKVLSDHTYIVKPTIPSLNDYVPPQTIKESYINCNIMADEGYSLPNPDSIGLFVHNALVDNLPSNASDEIKAEFQYSHEDSPVVLPRQMSVPSAPEEDVDESGLDVNSIEQDAKKDFPIFEEFVIEPSETDDDKIEYKEREKSDDTQNDSFTNRLERFMKVEHIELPNTLLSAPSPSVHIPSYFDTGNYAAENHYRNSLTSETSLRTFGSITNLVPSNIPPGFEEEYGRRSNNASSVNAHDHDRDVSYIPYIPDTSTQTRPTFSPTFSTAHGTTVVTCESITTTKMSELIAQNKLVMESVKTAHPETVFSKHFSEMPSINEALTSELFKKNDTQSPIAISTLKDTPDKVENSTLPDFMNIHNQGASERTEKILAANFVQKEPKIDNPVSETTLPPFALMFGAKNDPIIHSEQIAHITQEVKESTEPNPLQAIPSIPVAQKPLPDPINFFSSNSESPESNQGFNRLASYFASPAKPNEKSFFELSQSQDHLRHKIPASDALQTDIGSGDSKDNMKSFFQLDQSQNHYRDLNLPQDKIVANMKLMQQLTSIENYEVKPEQIVKIVNYFTVEYNNDFKEITTDFDKGDPESFNNKKQIPKETNKAEVIFDQETLNNIIKNCEYCCDLKCGCISKFDDNKKYDIFNTEVSPRKTMDNDKKSKRDNDSAMDGSTDANDATRNSVTVEFGVDPDEGSTSEVTALNERRSTSEYSPVKHHWFYRVDADGKSMWRGFSVVDSKALEDAYHSPDLNENIVVPTDGGRFDVNVVGRLRTPVYWSDKPSVVRRCSWFYKGTTDPRYVPYSEQVAEKLEEEYRHGITTGSWHRRLALPNNELVVMHGPSAMVHFFQADLSPGFGSQPLFQFGKRVYRNPPKIRVLRDQRQKIDHLVFLVHGAGEYRHQKQKEEQSSMRHRLSTRVLRGHDEIEIEDIEPSNIEHLLMLCHGVGSVCDMRFRAVEEVVEDFRATSHQLLQSHYKNSYENGTIGRVEVLPISWHATLHSGETGVDRRLATITLESIPRLRAFTNDTVLDVLFYTSPVYSQTIIDTVCAELNRIYRLFKARNPNFTGGVSLGGHSLGSVILYDLLSHQTPVSPDRKSNKHFVSNASVPCPPVNYPQLEFKPDAMYALGSPIAIFECIRGVDSLGLDFALPTCPKFYNIFHPYDPIAYRIEPLINPQLREVKPLLIPHHKGRKRMHLELKDTMARVGADIKQKLIESIKTTWSSMWKTQPPPDRHLEKVVEEELEKGQLTEDTNKEDAAQSTEKVVTPEMLGKLNSEERVDYVLQEAPLEMINEYLFAMSSHVCYWESEDTMLLMLREIYSSLGVHPDSTVPQQSLTVHRTRTVNNDEKIMMNASGPDYPSTSRDGT